MKKVVAQTFCKMTNNTKAGEMVVKTHDAVKTMSLLWNDSDLNEKERCEVLKFLQFLCTLAGGHSHIISAMTGYKTHFKVPKILLFTL
jgi:hypothetical protein